MSIDRISFNLLASSDVPSSRYKAGETIFHEGDAATELFVVKAGQVGIMCGNRLLDTLDAGSIFGEMALIDSAPRSATAVAMSEVELIPVSEKQFLFMVSQTPFFALNVMRILARRLRDSNKAI